MDDWMNQPVSRRGLLQRAADYVRRNWQEMETASRQRFLEEHGREFRDEFATDPPDWPENTTPQQRTMVFARLKECADKPGLLSNRFTRLAYLTVRFTNITREEITAQVVNPQVDRQSAQLEALVGSKIEFSRRYAQNVVGQKLRRGRTTSNRTPDPGEWQ